MLIIKILCQVEAKRRPHSLDTSQFHSQSLINLSCKDFHKYPEKFLTTSLYLRVIYKWPKTLERSSRAHPHHLRRRQLSPRLGLTLNWELMAARKHHPATPIEVCSGCCYLPAISSLLIFYQSEEAHLTLIHKTFNREGRSFWMNIR